MSAPWLWRLALVVGCAAAVGLACSSADPAASLQADPALARLLRGMALLKGVATAVAIIGVAWRLGWRVTPPIATGYLAAAWLMSGATTLIWRLASIPVAAIVFHTAFVGLLVAAWRDDRRSQRSA